MESTRLRIRCLMGILSFFGQFGGKRTAIAVQMVDLLLV